MSIFTISCSNENENENSLDEVSQNVQILCDYLSDLENQDKTIYIKSFGLDCYEIDTYEQSIIIPVKTRTEAPSDWIILGRSLRHDKYR